MAKMGGSARNPQKEGALTRTLAGSVLENVTGLYNPVYGGNVTVQFDSPCVPSAPLTAESVS